MHLKMPLSSRVCNCQILNKVVESQLFTSLSNRYQQWLSGSDLIQMSAFSASYSRINPCFTAGRRIRASNLSRPRNKDNEDIFASVLKKLHVPGCRAWRSTSRHSPRSCTRLRSGRSGRQRRAPGRWWASLERPCSSSSSAASRQSSEPSCDTFKNQNGQKDKTMTEKM